jgi:hypothetical protein
MKITRQEFTKAIREEIIEMLSGDNLMDEATTKPEDTIKIVKEVDEEENNSFPPPGVGSFVTIPINLTTDPINKQGEKGEVKFIDNDGNFYILFDDGLLGAYQGDIFDLQEGVNLNEEDEDEMDKKATKAASSGKKDSIISLANQLVKVATEMKSLAKEYKSAKEGKETEKEKEILSKLKELTAQKKKLEAKLS